MGGPRENPIARAAFDIGRGATGIIQNVATLGMRGGNIQDSLRNIVAGQTNLMSLGATEKLGVMGDTGKEVMSFEQQKAERQAKLEAEQAVEADRRQKIMTRLEEEIKLRQRQPGKSATLLTSTLTPNGQNTNTLLTSVTGNR